MFKKKWLENHLEDVRLEDNSKIEEAFPWLSKFNKIIRSCTGSRNYQHLERLLLLYTQNILFSVAESNVKFNDEINLKNHINKMLIFFHMYWLDIKQDIADHSQYLNKMSTLLNVYIDMELKTSSHVIRDSFKIAAKILAALYIYLNNSEEHIFRVLLRIKHTTRKDTKICNYIFTKSFTNLKTKTTSITDVAYIRYLLAFKIWRKMEETTRNLIFSDKKERIKLALMLLGPRMPKLQDELLQFVPRPPTGQENETLWLIESNLFDTEQVHKQFLLFEDKMDNSTSLQCTKTIHDQNYSKYQKHQMNSLFNQSDSNGDTSKQKINKCLGSSRNNNTLPNNKNKFYLQKNASRRKIKSLEKINESRKTIIIDLTEDDEVSKKKRTKQSSKCLEVIKDIMRSKKHTNSSKYSDKLASANVKVCFNEDNKGLKEKIDLEYKPVIKISDSSENCTSVSSRSSLNICQTMFDQNINELKVTANISKQNKLENCVSSYVTIGTSSYDNSITQNKSVLTSQEESAMETIPLFKTCQNNVADQQNCQFDCKQELPTSTDCMMQKSCTCCNTMHVINHFINLNSTTDLSSQIRQMIKQEVSVAKAQGNLHNTFSDNENDIKLACDTDIIYTLRNNCNQCVYLLNHTDKHVMTVHAESDDKCTVSTTFIEDQIVKPSSYSQHVNFGNVRMNDYDSVAKYSEATTKEQQKGSVCDSTILSDRLHSIFDTDSFNIGPNSEVDCNLKSFPKEEETDKITNNYVDNLEPSSLNNIQSETLLEDFFWQSSEQFEVNLTGELNDSKDTCTVSTTSVEDQIVESSLENIISFSHDIQTLEDILSNNTTNFLPQQESLFELNNVYIDTSFNKNVLCDNQNDAIDSSIDLVASHLNTDDTFLRLPAKSDKLMSVNHNEFHHNAKYLY